jgi:hypothetical protein
MPPEARGRLAFQPLAGYEPEVGRAMWPVEDARRRTAHALAGIDVNLVDWLPPAGPGVGTQSLGTLLYHVAIIEADWLYEEALGRPWPPALKALFPYPVRDEQGRLTVVTGESLEQHWARLVEVRRSGLRRRPALSFIRAAGWMHAPTHRRRGLLRRRGTGWSSCRCR